MNIAEWLMRSVAGGTLVLLVASMLMRCTLQPVKQQRLAEWGLAAALVLEGLCWLQPFAAFTIYQSSPEATDIVSSVNKTSPEAVKGNSSTQEHTFPNDSPPSFGAQSQVPPELGEAWVAIPPYLPLGVAEKPLSQPGTSIEPNDAASPGAGHIAASPEGLPQATETISSNLAWPNWQVGLKWLAIVYATGAFFILGRWLLGQMTLTRLLRQAEPAPAWVHALLCELKPVEILNARLLISDSLRVPLSCGIWRPTILLPGRMVKAGDDKVLRWVLCHELTHLERRDAWSCFLFNLGQVVYYYLPWFWRLRRQVWLCQEYLADASAAEAEARADYAQFLLGMT